MISNSIGANPYIVSECIAVAALLGIPLFLADPFPRGILRRHWRVLLLLVAVTLIWRIPTSGRFFHGLEYEDAYVYTVAARQIVGVSF